MKFTQQQAERLYALVMEQQAAMVARGEVHPSQAHEVAEGRITADGQILVECTCGRGMFRDSSDQSQGDYALHVAKSLDLQVRFGRAA
jgi:hypothetical protein